MVVKNKLDILPNKLTEEEIEAGRISESARDNSDKPSAVDALGIVKYKLMPEQCPISQKPSKNSVQDVEDEEIEQAEIYAKLYNDGTLAFTATDRVLDGKTLVEDYGRVEVYSDNNKPKWTKNYSKIQYVDIADTIQPTTTAYWFYFLKSLKKIDNISNLNTSKVVDMSMMFSWCISLIDLDISNFNTSNVTNMSGMFSDCPYLKVLDLSNFDTGNVTNMSGMFNGCNRLNNLNISSFNTEKVTNMFRMFSGVGCYGTLGRRKNTRQHNGNRFKKFQYK